MPNTITVRTRDGEMKLYDVEPEQPAKGAVIVIQEAFGVNNHIEDVTQRVAKLGYRAVAPHVFYRTGDPVLAYDDLQNVMPHIQAMTKAGVENDLDATVGYLSENGFLSAQTGIVGFCLGGSISFYAAVHHPFGAAVTFYGGGVGSGRFGYPSQIELAPQLQAPWLGLYGDTDQSIPIEEVEALRLAAAKAPVPTEIVRYPEGTHGFHCDVRESYHRQTAEDAWQRTVGWFDTHLAKKP